MTQGTTAKLDADIEQWLRCDDEEGRAIAAGICNQLTATLKASQPSALEQVMLLPVRVDTPNPSTSKE
ncbi:MAG: hypothetical protein ACRCUB_12745 [Plesiomonas shigelloides]